MKDTILQEVRAARAAVAEDFNFDLHQFFAWAAAHATAEREAKSLLPINSSETLKAVGKADTSTVNHKRRRLTAPVPG
ncbi:MAG: hypothetical protein V4726_20460 [Verrucomicrobiota bacterium]